MDIVPNTECIHGLTMLTCDHCLGALRRAPYRQAIAKVGWWEQFEAPNRRDCELCSRRGANKGNRVYVRIPRPPMLAFGQGVPSYPPSFEGPLIEAPRIYKATHRIKRGKFKGWYACDRCHNDGRPATPVEVKVKVSAKPLEASDLFI